MSRRHGAVAFVAAATLTLGGVSAVAAFATNGGGQGDHKTALCHRTASDSNPYVYIEVDDHALQAHLTNGKGHFPKHWKSDGTWRGVAHSEGDSKDDYLASSEADCQDTEPTTEPTEEPTETPTTEPTEEPTETPSETPSETPTDEPTDTPTDKPKPHKPEPHTVTHPDTAPPPSPPVVIDAGL